MSKALKQIEEIHNLCSNLDVVGHQEDVSDDTDSDIEITAVIKAEPTERIVTIKQELDTGL